MNKVMIYSANLGGFEKRPVLVAPGTTLTAPPGTVVYYRTLDSMDFPPRQNMSPRLQARIPKMFAWDLFPGYNTYIWLDSSFRFVHPTALEWILTRLSSCDMALFRHPTRATIKAEASFILRKLEAGSRYIRERYEGEDLHGQLRAIDDPLYTDDVLFATMLVAYRASTKTERLLTDWWVHTSRFHAVDQLALPYLVWTHHVSVGTLEGDPYHHPMLAYVRGTE